MGEEWRKIKIEGLHDYEVSNLGRVKAMKKTLIHSHGGIFNYSEKIFKPPLDSKGYPFVGLSGKDKPIQYRVHRLVASAFLPNPENKCCVNHINGVRYDNRLENLEWATLSENTRNAMDRGVAYVPEARPKLTQQQAEDIRMEFSIGGVTKASIAKKYKIDPSVISRIISGHRYVNKLKK